MTLVVGAHGEPSPTRLELQEQHTVSNDDSIESNSESNHSKKRFQADLRRNSNSTRAREVLDKNYKVRNRDYKDFFGVGRVFMTLWTEQLGPAMNMRDGNVSEIIFGEKVHSKIRRFVVVRQHDRFCTCLPITSYNSRNQKKGLNLKDHGVIYTHNLPRSINEILRTPVRVHAAKDATFRDVSLINYARTYTIEMNLKVLDGGELDSDSKKALYRNFSDVFTAPEESLDVTILPHVEGVSDKEVSEQGADQRPPGKQVDIGTPQLGIFDYSEAPRLLSLLPAAASQYLSSGIEDCGPSTSKLEGTGQLASSFEVIGKPPRFFRLGRVFKVLWTEPAGTTAKDSDPTYYHKVSYNELVYTKIRRFVVIRERTHSCLCLPLYTYGGQGTTKSDVRSQDHALVYSSEQQDPPAPTTEEVLEKEPFSIVVEDSNEQIDAMTRMNFSQVYTIQHNVKVAKVGRIAKDQLDRLNSYFVESITAT